MIERGDDKTQNRGGKGVTGMATREEDFVERMIIKIATWTRVGKWFNTRKQLDKMDALLKKYPPENSQWLINFMGQTSYKFNEMFKKDRKNS